MLWNFFKRGVKRVGCYDLLGQVGKGGGGAVYKAQDPGTGRTVAIKILSAELADDPRAFERFEREFRAAQQLQDPHIIRGLGFGREGGVRYMVLEFAEGGSLAALIAERGRLPPDEAIAIMAQVAWALHRAHAHDLVHRDVKPENILFAGGVAKLTDFGLVKDLAALSSLTQTASALGTPSYMAPEQYEDAKRVDCRCDIYGLAGTLYNAVTGHTPFAVEGSRGLMRRKLDGELVPPRRFAPELTMQAEWAITRALSVSPSLRPNSCADFIKSLTGAELRPAGAAAAPPARERRGAVRYACETEGVCRRVEGKERDGWPADVQNLSTSGVGLILRRRFEPGTILLVEVLARRSDVTRTLMGRVVHVEAQGEQRWSVGCRLAQELKEEELRELL